MQQLQLQTSKSRTDITSLAYVLKCKGVQTEAIKAVYECVLPNYSQNMHFANSWEEQKQCFSPLFSFNTFGCYDVNITLSTKYE